MLALTDLQRPTLALTFALLLASCGGGGVDAPGVSVASPAPPGPPASVEVAGGNGQTTLQHTTLAAPLQARVVDALGNGAPGVTVTFDAGAGGGTLTPASSVTDASGIATWNSPLHTAGTQLVDASVAGLGTAHFSITVTPSPHLYDGAYTCSFTTPAFSSPGPQVDLNLAGPAVTGTVIANPIRGIIAGSSVLDESTGALTALLQTSLDFHVDMSGAFSVDASDHASGAGAYTLTEIHAVVGSGTWTCQRL